MSFDGKLNYLKSGERRRRESLDASLGESEQPDHVENDQRLRPVLQRIGSDLPQRQARVDRHHRRQQVRQQEGHPRPQPGHLPDRFAGVRAQVSGRGGRQHVHTRGSKQETSR